MKHMHMQEFMNLVNSANWHFSWFRESSLAPIIQYLGGPLDERRGCDPRHIPTDRIRLIQKAIYGLSDESRRKYVNVLGYLADTLDVFTVHNPLNALKELERNPEFFLNHNLLIIQGAGVSNIRDCYIGLHLNPPVGHGIPDATYSINPTHGGAMTNPRTFRAHNIRMVPATEDIDTTRIDGYPLTAAGPNFMITGLLTGCSFAVLRQGRSTLVSHIQPQPGGNRGTGAELKDTLEDTGRFNGYGALPLTRVFGKGDYVEKAFVIGVWREGDWQIYGQVCTGSNGTLRINRVVRII